MKKFVAILVVLAFVIPAFAVEDGEVAYVGGTVSAIKDGLVGKLDTTQERGLVFAYFGGSLEIPYDKIESYEYSKEVGVHLGVVAATAVSLIKRRWRQHFVRISWEDANGKKQAAVFEIPKTMPRVLMGILKTKASKGCKSGNSHCSGF